MIDLENRKAIYHCHEKGMSIREISRRFGLSRNTVRKIILKNGQLPDKIRKDKIEIDQELLSDLYTKCNGWMQRMHEILTEDHGVKIGYSTLTRLVKQMGLRGVDDRCGEVDDKPGEEMQHDTSNYMIKLGDHNRRVIGSLLYFRYSKLRYLKFYRSFNRFKMKCFFHEALTHFEYCGKKCIIDNTNLARLSGTGKNAKIVPEMESFSKQYGFKFICHEKGHSNRKAGNERGFWTVETNFFPGRQFDSLEDLNQKAYEWATVRMAKRRMGKSRLIPIHAFEYEKPYLNPLPPEVPAPYIFDHRCIDQYGYVSYNGNFYFIPGNGRFKVKILEYSNHIEIYKHREKLIAYPLPVDGTKNQVFKPKGYRKITYQPNSRKKSSEIEEKNLRALSEDVNSYMNLLVKQKGIKKHHFIRQLSRLSKKITLPVFSQALKRAQKYGILNIDTIERICRLIMNSDSGYQLPLFDVNENFMKRDSFLEGEFSGETDLSQYDRLFEDKDG